MPSVSAKQHRYMEMIAHGGHPRTGGGPSPAVAKEFVAADKAKRSAHEQHFHKAFKGDK